MALFFLTAAVTYYVATVVGAATSPIGLGCLAGSAVAVCHAALLRAADRPALQMVAAWTTGACLAVAALTWRHIGASAMLGTMPAGAAGQCTAPSVC